MPKPTKGPRLGGSPTHERLMMANLASQLFEHGRITTTETKAKRVRPLAEKMITKAKRGDLHNRRIVLKTIRDKDVVYVLFDKIAPQMAGRDGGYTRITKIGNRQGDNAPMAIIELVTESVEDSRKAKAKAAPKAAAPKAEKAKKDAPKATAAKAVETPAADAEASKFGEGSFVGAEPPAGFDIKGNEDSMKFHTPESRWYDQTIAEVWFNSADAAKAAGFVDAMEGHEPAADDK